MAKRICVVCGYLNDNFVKECINCGNSNLTLTRRVEEDTIHDRFRREH